MQAETNELFSIFDEGEKSWHALVLWKGIPMPFNKNK